jgi:hypothetical protein
VRVYEIRDPVAARRHLLDGLLMTRTAPVDGSLARRALEWTFEMAGGGEPLPPVGFIADVGNVALGLEMDPGRRDELPTPPGFDHRLVRRYDDYVLGKLYGDLAFERGADALLRYQGRDRTRGLAFLLIQTRRRAELGGALLSPAVIKSLLQERPEQLLAEAWAAVEHGEVSSALVDDYEAIVNAVHNLGEVLGVEDLFELEHGMALAKDGQRVARHDVLRVAEALDRGLPKHKVRSAGSRRQVATNLLDEDLYPVGGFTSISNRGSIESLLHSQLAFMERDERPDLFDIKFLRDELLYYSRDENQFLRRRQSFLFALYPDLAQIAKISDPALGRQRMTLVLGSLLTAVHKLRDWLTNDALRFEFLVLGRDELAPQAQLLETLFREEITLGAVSVEYATPSTVAPRCQERARHSLCNCLAVSMVEQEIAAPWAVVSQLIPNGPIPQVMIDGQFLPSPEVDQPLDGWHQMLFGLLQRWLH